MIRIDAGPRDVSGSHDPPRFAKFVRGVFDHRRKTLRAALRFVLEKECVDRLGNKFDLTRRPEQLSVDEWAVLAGEALGRERSE